MIPSRDERGKVGFELLLSVMPEGRENKVKELGLLIRGREIKNTVDFTTAGTIIPDRR
jgi:hypothetical protein